MSPRTKEQFEEIRTRKKDLIRTKALKLFAQKGYHTTTISMIANDAGISKGLLYNYYSSKEELLREIIANGMEQLMESVDPNKDGVLTGEELAYMLKLNKEILTRDRRFWSLYFSILAQPSVLEIVKNEITDLIDNMLNMFTDYFRREGYEDPETEALILGSILDGVSFHYIFNPKTYPLDKVIDRLINMYSKNSHKK